MELPRVNIADFSPEKVSVDKIIALVTLILILSAQIVIVATPPAAGYEVSIYKAYPPYLWFLLLAAFSCGISILIHNAFARSCSRWWIFSFIMLLYINLLIILLPFCRGYITLGRGDVLTHIGYIKDILFTGHFPLAGMTGANHYPVIHIIGADLCLLTGLTPELWAEIFPGLFILFYIVSVHLLARETAPQWGQALLITAFGSLLLFKHSNLMLAPSVICFYLLPLNLFVLNKRRSSHQKMEFSTILILLLLIIPFLHPGEGTIFLFLFILVLDISRRLYLLINRQNRNNVITDHSASQALGITYPELILVITWFAWFSSYSVFGGTIRSVWNWLTNEIGTTTAIEYGEILSKANLSPSEFLHLIFSTFGQALIYFLVGLALIIILLRRFLLHNRELDQQQFSYSLLFIIFGMLMLVAFFSKAIWVEYNREMIYVIFAVTILNGLGLYDLFHYWHRKIVMLCIFIIIISSATFGLFNTFPSPTVKEGNSQVTAMEMVGMEHFLEYRDDALLIDNLGINQMRFAYSLRGTNDLLPNIRYLNSNSPDHFGYDENESYGQSYTGDRYFVESKLSRISYPEIFPEYEHLWRFTPEDFYHLDNSDNSSSRIYFNGEFWVYYIKSCKV